MTPFSEEDLAVALREGTPAPPLAPDRAARARARAVTIRRRRRLVTSAATVLAVVGLVTAGMRINSGSGNDADPTTGDGTHAVNQDPGCAGATCDPARIAAAIQRPLHLPGLAGDGSCPVSPRVTLPAGAGFSDSIRATGDGALHLATATAIPVRPDDSHRGDAWMEQKVIWVFDESYAGPLLLRGGRIDRPGPLQFLSYLGASDYQGDAGSGPRPGLLYVRGGLGADSSSNFGMTSDPSGIYVKGPGCYAIQVDGEGFTQDLVFQVVRERS